MSGTFGCGCFTTLGCGTARHGGMHACLTVGAWKRWLAACSTLKGPTTSHVSCTPHTHATVLFSAVAWCEVHGGICKWCLLHGAMCRLQRLGPGHAMMWLATGRRAHWSTLGRYAPRARRR